MLDGQIILQGVAASFGRLEQPADDGSVLYASTFTDASGLAVTVLWDAVTVRNYLEKSLESMAGIVSIPKPKLEIARALPPRNGAAS